MKLLKNIAVLLATIVLLAACNSSNGEPHEYDEYDYNEITIGYCPQEAAEEPAPTTDDTEHPEEAAEEKAEEPPCPSEEQLAAEMAHFLALLQSIWDEDNGTMWGIPLHVPIVLVCRATQFAVASRPDVRRNFTPQYVDGIAVYVGTRTPVGSYHYTLWDGAYGVIWSWQYVQARIHGEGLESILRTIFHTGFHALQPEVMGFRGAGHPGLSNNPEAWISFGLETNALIQALQSTGDERQAIIHDALSIRNARRQTFRSADAENWIKISEGTTTYTDLHLVHGPYEAVDRVINWLATFEYTSFRDDSAAVWFAYVGGAAYGILLDAFGIDWRPYIDRYADLGLMLKEGLGITEFMPLEEIDLEKYGYSEIAARRRP